MIELTNKIKYLIEKYPDIKFLILPWHNTEDGDMLDKENFLKGNIIEIKEGNNKYMCVNSFLGEEKLHVWNKAKAFNGDYEYNHPEDHASIEGHQRVANMVINHIKKNKNIEIVYAIRNLREENAILGLVKKTYYLII